METSLAYDLKKAGTTIKNNKGYRSLEFLPLHVPIISFILFAIGDKEDADYDPLVANQCFDSSDAPNFL